MERNDRKRPIEEVDHKDRNPFNNRWKNLREATHRQNLRNRGLQSNNTSGYPGIDKIGNKWRARVNGIYSVHLGMFSSKQGAIKARKQAEMKYFGQFQSNLR